MNGLFAANFVQDLQGTDNIHIRANAGCKHFDAYIFTAVKIIIFR